MSDRHIGILWLHGGGYQAGMPKLVYMSAAMDLVRTYNVTLFVPAYRRIRGGAISRGVG